MRSHPWTLGSTLAAVGLAAALGSSLTTSAQAMPERFADAGTIVWCDGENGWLEAIDTTMAGTSWSAGLLAGHAFAAAGGETVLFDGTGLHGSFPAYDQESGAELGDLIVDGTITYGETEVLSGWDIDDDGRRTRTEGTRTPLSGEVSLSLGEESTTLQCAGWQIDTETFRLTQAPAADVFTSWWTDSYELGQGAGSIGFYGERKHELGVALDLFGPPYLFGGERLQIRNGHVDGSLLLRDPETWVVVGVAEVSGTVSETGREQTIEHGTGYRSVSDLVHYDVTLTITTEQGEWTGTWAATHETNRTLMVVPPKSL